MSSTLGTAQITLEHFLRSLVYRFEHVTAGAPASFGDFKAAEDVRSPGAIVRHMTGLLSFTQQQLEGGERKPLEPLEWQKEIERFLAAARKLEQHLHKSAGVTGEIGLDQLWRGPMIDAATHIGQLAMLRRLAGSPIEGVRYWQVEMPPLNVE